MKIDRQLLVTGIPLIDRQHEEYADLVDRVFELAESGSVDGQELSVHASAVIRYATEHFDAEEHIMRFSNYPAYEQHRTKHNVFRNRSDILASVPDADIAEYAVRLSRWLIEWFCDQVQTDDMKLALFLKKRPVANRLTRKTEMTGDPLPDPQWL